MNNKISVINIVHKNKERNLANLVDHFEGFALPRLELVFTRPRQITGEQQMIGQNWLLLSYQSKTDTTFLWRRKDLKVFRQLPRYVKTMEDSILEHTLLAFGTLGYSFRNSWNGLLLSFTIYAHAYACTQRIQPWKVLDLGVLELAHLYRVRSSRWTTMPSRKISVDFTWESMGYPLVAYTVGHTMNKRVGCVHEWVWITANSRTFHSWINFTFVKLTKPDSLYICTCNSQNTP